MKKKKRLTLGLACCSLALASTATALSLFGADAETNALIDIFAGTSYRFEKNYADGEGRKGTLFVPSAVGAYIATEKPISGVFQCELGFLDSEIASNETQYRLVFSDTENGRSFALVMDISAGDVNAYIEYGESKFGVSYDSSYNQVAQTLAKNAVGVYTGVSATEAVSVSFDPNTMQVRINGYLVWDMSKSNNDGLDVGFYLDGFARYNASLILSKNEYGSARVLVYSVLGCDLSKANSKDGVAPSLFADVKYNAIVGQEWSVSKPVVFDTSDGNIASEKVVVSVENSSGESVLEQKYTDGLTFTAESAGVYRIVYTATDADGNIGRQTFDVEAFENAPTAEYIVERAFGEKELGVGSEITIPVCRASDPMFRFDTLQYASVRVVKNGDVVENFTADKAVRYTFAEVGEYRVEFYLAGAQNSARYNFSITSDIATLSFVEYEETYELQSVLSLQKATVTFRSQTKDADCVVISPNGTVFSGERLTLDRVGKYTIRYTAVFDGKQKTFEREILVQNSVNNVIFDNAGASAALTNHPKDSTMSGLLITSYPRTDTTFRAPIDFNAQGESENFIELISVARNMGEQEYNMFYVTLTDTENEANFIQIRAYAHYHTHQTMLAVSIGNDTPLLFNLNGVPTQPTALSRGWLNLEVNQIGTPVNHSFANLGSDLSASVLKIRLDYKTMKLYAYAGDDEPIEVADLDDASFVQKWGKSFEDFKNGTAYCSVRYEFRSAGTMTWDDTAHIYLPAQYFVRKVGGYDYSRGSVADSLSPVISLDEPKEISDAIVNWKYKLFEASAVDNTCGVVPVKTYVAFHYGKSSQILLNVTDGAFIPPTEGEYTIVYIAEDDFGNRTEVARTVRAVAKAESPLSVDFENVDTETLTGKKLYVKSYEISGGVGNYTAQVNVFIGNVVLETYRDEVGTYFLPEQEGMYTVKYTVADYIGETLERRYTVTVAKNPLPIFTEDPTMPIVLTAGQENVLPTIEATDYYAYPKRNAEVKVYVKYPDASEYEEIKDVSSFVPVKEKLQGGDILTFKYEATGSADADNVSTIYKEVKVASFDARSGSIDLTEYFVCENAVVYGKAAETKDTALYVALKAGESSIAYGKKLLAKGFTYEIRVQDAVFDRMYFVLTDSVNGKQRIRLDIEKSEAGEYTYTINGGTVKYEAEYGNGNLRLSYDPSKQTVNLTKTGENGRYVRDTIYGENFAGFESGFVFVETGFYTVTAGNIVIAQICGQNISTDGIDSGAPVLVTEKAYGGNAYLGDDYYIPSALAGDVYGYITKTTVTVKDANGQYVTAKDGTVLNAADATRSYEIVLNVLGRYSLRYSCTDSNGVSSRSNNVNLYVNKKMETAEVSITFGSAIETEKKLNSVLSLPTVTAADGYEIKCVLFDPNGCVVSVSEDNKATLSKKGTYTVIYTVCDEIGNLKTYRFYVNVK